MIEPYSHSEHSGILGRWLSHWNIKMPPAALLSDIGFCANGIAIGFLYTTNSKQAIIDRIATDPNSTKEARDVALSDLLHHLDVVADALGFKLLTIMSRIPAMQDRMLSMGFYKDHEYMLYYKLLGGA